MSNGDYDGTLDYNEAMARQPEPDVRIEDHGTLVLFVPLNTVALAWLQDHTDGHWYGEALAVEPRYAYPLAVGLHNDGYTLSGEDR